MNTETWDRYQKGINYKEKIGLFENVRKSERFYSGDQWNGVNANGLPTPILNVMKRIIDYKISAIMSDMVTMQYSADGVSDDTQDPMKQSYREASGILSEYSKTLWENLKVDSMNERGLLDSALSGDMASHWFWNDIVDVGDGQQGDINGELIDNVNVYLGDPNSAKINDAYEPLQPYIILAFRRQVSDVKREAKRNKVSDWEMISSDDETDNLAGDRSQQELEDDDGKCIVLLEYTKELLDGVWHIFAEKSVKDMVIREKWDTGLHKYPVAMMNWYIRKGSAHGESEATPLIPNQIMINQQAAMIALWIKLHGFPKVLFDSTKINSWTNDIATAIPVNGTDGGGVSSAAVYMQPAQISAAVMRFMEWFITATKEMAGASDAALGNANPTNTSAIIVLQKATAVPLSSIKRRFYEYIEDIGLIWLDFWISKYAEYPQKNLEITVNNQKQVIPLDMSILSQARLKLKIDVGQSSVWNEAAAIQSLDNLLRMQMIDFTEYLKRLPNGVIPDRQGLIDQRESVQVQKEAQDKEFTYGMMSAMYEQIAPTLPPKAIKQLDMLKQNEPEQYEAQVKQLINENLKKPYAGNVEGRNEM